MPLSCDWYNGNSSIAPQPLSPANGVLNFYIDFLYRQAYSAGIFPGKPG